MEKLFTEAKKIIDNIAEINPDQGLKLYIQLAYSIDKYDVKK